MPSGDLSGNTVAMSPELTINGLVRYPTSRGNHGAPTLRTDCNHQDKVYFDALNNPLLSQGSYGLWNGRVACKSLDEARQVSVSGRNLAVKHYRVYAFDPSCFGVNEEMPGAPRSFAIDRT